MKTRKEYLDRAKLALDKLDARIEVMEKELALKKLDAKSAYYKHLEDVKIKRSELAHKIDAIKATSGDAWDRLKEGLDTILEDIKTTYRNTKEALHK